MGFLNISVGVAGGVLFRSFTIVGGVNFAIPPRLGSSPEKSRSYRALCQYGDWLCGISERLFVIRVICEGL